MSRGQPGTEPDGIAGDCFWILAMCDCGEGLSVSGLTAQIAAENTSLALPFPSRAQVSEGLKTLAFRDPPLVERSGRYATARWHISDHGYRMIDVWCPDDDPERYRRPCGLGWPA